MPPPPPPPPPNLLCFPFGKKVEDGTAASMTEKSLIYDNQSRMSTHSQRSWASMTPSQHSLASQGSKGSERTQTQTYRTRSHQSYRSVDDVASLRSGGTGTSTDPNGARLVRSGTRSTGQMMGPGMSAREKEKANNRLSFDSANTDYDSAFAQSPEGPLAGATMPKRKKDRNTLRKGLFSWGRKKERTGAEAQSEGARGGGGEHPEMIQVYDEPPFSPMTPDEDALLDADIDDDGSDMIAPLPILQRRGLTASPTPLSRQTSNGSGRSGRSGVGSASNARSPPQRSATMPALSTPQRRPTINTGGSGGGAGPYRRPSMRSYDSQNTLVGSAFERKLTDEGRVFMVSDTTGRLDELRALMQKNNIDYYVVPSEDSHLSEYVAPGDKRREWISGFTGSAGQAIISANNAYLVTDSRYWLQAGKELDKNWQLVKSNQNGLKDWVDFLVARTASNVVNSGAGARVGIDTRLIAHDTATDLIARLQATSSKLVYLPQNLVDLVWGIDRPSRSKKPVFLHPTEFAGEPAYSKISKLREWLAMQPPKVVGGYKRVEDMPRSYFNVATLVTQLDSIAYLLNLRGQDIEYNPVFQAYFFLSVDNAYLFIETSKIQDDVREYLDTLHIEIREYADFWKFLNRREWGEGKVLLNPNTTPYAITLILTSFRWSAPASGTDFVAEMKAIKNSTEITGLRKAYLRDAVAFVRFFAWLEEKLKSGYEITEFEAAHRIDEYRYKTRNFMGPAYETISATGANAALPHYTPTKNESKYIEKTTPYLNDSGGQYRDGTCDTTRTVHFGRPTAEQMEAFTRVLQGHIAIDTAVFPDGTTGKQLDVLARNALWKDGMNYLHGTGHGFGSYLNVHEGPQGFGIDFPFTEGHVLTNEPGFYKDGKWGIRIESALVVKRVKTKHAGGEEAWLGFERLTCVPIQTKMVKEQMLSKEEKAWIKRHNQECKERLLPLLGEDKRAIAWVKRQADRGLGVPSSVPGGIYVDWD